MSEIANNKRLAKNTIYLYIRTLVVMLITLYTSRVVLQTLGAVDFGIYNVVGGIVVMFSFISGAMATATQRFMSYALGKGDNNEVQRIFSLSLLSYYVIAGVIIILAEIIGLPFLTTQMNFPDNRWTAVHWVYQLSILSFCINIIRTPYTASIIAYERMTFYAYISIIENVLKLVIVFMLTLFNDDKLIIYVILMTVVIAITNLIYYFWCRKNFQTCTYSYFWDKDMFRNLFSFSGWSMFGSLAAIGASQGVNIIFNIFTNVLVNAAMGIAGQVQSAINAFVNGFQTAMSPQIVKLYASGNIESMNVLINRASRLSFCLLFLFGLPAIIYNKLLLQVWLGEVPCFAVQFSQLMILFSMIESLSAPLFFSVQATGRIKYYQILISILLLFNLPIAYFLLKMGFSPVECLITKVIMQFLIHIARIIYLGKVMPFKISLYLKNVMGRSFLLILFALPSVFFLKNNIELTLINTFYFVLLLFQNFVLVFLIGFDQEERQFVIHKMAQWLNR